MNNKKNKKMLLDSEKLTALLQFLQTDIANFATKFNIPSSHLYNLNNGKINEFSQDTRIKILEGIPNINPRWLITGTGPITVADNSGDIHNNNVGGDLLGNGATKTSSPQDEALMISTISRLSNVIQQQSEQITNLIQMLNKKI